MNILVDLAGAQHYGLSHVPFIMLQNCSEFLQLTEVSDELICTFSGLLVLKEKCNYPLFQLLEHRTCFNLGLSKWTPCWWAFILLMSLRLKVSLIIYPYGGRNHSFTSASLWAFWNATENITLEVQTLTADCVGAMIRSTAASQWEGWWFNSSLCTPACSCLPSTLECGCLSNWPCWDKLASPPSDWHLGRAPVTLWPWAQMKWRLIIDWEMNVVLQLADCLAELLLDSWVDDHSCVLSYWLLSEPLGASIAKPLHWKQELGGAHNDDPYHCKAILSSHSSNSWRPLLWKVSAWQQEKKEVF